MKKLFFLRKEEEKSRHKAINIIKDHGKLHHKEDPMSDEKINLDERLKKYPYLKSRLESILDIVEDPSCSVDKADEAEQLLIEEMQQFGKEALHDWAVGKEEKKVKELLDNNDGVKKHSKKN